MKPYSEYKPSGVEWLGDVPRHWGVQRLKNIGQLKGGAGFPHQYQGEMTHGIPFFKVGDMGVKENAKLMKEWQHTISNETAETLGAYVFPPKTVVFAKVGAALMLNRRRLLICPSCIDNNMMGFIPRSAYPAWVLYWMNTIDLGMTVNPGAVPSVNEGQVEKIPTVVPPIPEQQAIVHYLDYIDQRIQRYIAAKRKLIALLEEERQAIVNRAVTRGLNPDVRLKPSGVEWLGDVPEHWEVLALKRLANFKSGTGFPVDEQGQQDLEFPFFKVSDMNLIGNKKFMKSWNNTVSRITTSKLGSTIFPAGTILFPKVGGAMLTNKRRVVIKACCIDNNLMGCIVNRGNPEFIFLLLQRIDFAVIAKPGPVPAISEGEIADIKVAIPRLDEQTAIVTFLNEVTTGIDTKIARVRRQLDLMQEYRTRLIADVVTGKLDVREAAAHLPDEAEGESISPNGDIQ